MHHSALFTAPDSTDTSWREFSDRDAREAAILADLTADLLTAFGEPEF